MLSRSPPRHDYPHRRVVLPRHCHFPRLISAGEVVVSELAVMCEVWPNTSRGKAGGQPRREESREDRKCLMILKHFMGLVKVRVVRGVNLAVCDLFSSKGCRSHGQAEVEDSGDQTDYQSTMGRGVDPLC